MTEIMAFDPKRVNNAQAIYDAYLLGYLNQDDLVLDATYGLGRFWKLWRPDRLLANDRYVKSPEIDTHEDYRMLSSPPARYDVTVFDPPYKLNGTGGSHPSDEGYGVATPYQNIGEMLGGIDDGFVECLRVTKPGGYLLYKTQDQVVSGEKVWMSHDPLINDACDGMLDGDRPRVRLVDELYVCGYRKQPTDRKCKRCDGDGVDPSLAAAKFYADRGQIVACDECEGVGRIPIPQKHARSNVSVLQVFQRSK